MSSQIFSTLALEDSIYNLEGQNTNTDLEKQDAENPCLTELISSYITATDSLIGEIKKDFVSDQTLTENFQSEDLSSVNNQSSSVSKAEDSLPEEEYLNSFDISLDKERTAASYVELLRSYQVIFQKWQASEIKSQLNDMKIADLEGKIRNLEPEVEKVCISEEEGAIDWQDILTELGDRRVTNKLLKEKEEELLAYKKGKQALEEEVGELKRRKEEVIDLLEAERKKGECRIEEARVAGEKLESEHKAELKKKDVMIQELEDKIRKSEEKTNKLFGGRTISDEVLAVEKLKVEHNRIILMKDEKIKKLMEKIVEIAEENKVSKIKLDECKILLEGVDPKNTDKENLLKKIEEKDLEIRDKEAIVRTLQKDMERNEVEVLKTVQKLQLSHENVEALVRKERIKEEKLEEKDREIADLREKIKEGKTENQLLVENLCSARDENVKLKNERKAVSDQDVNKIYTEIKEFKKDIMKQVKTISNLHQRKENENNTPENNTPEKKIESKRCCKSKETLRNDQKCKRKPNRSVSKDCTLIDSESDYVSDISDPDTSHSGDEEIGRWRVVDGMWQQIPMKPGAKTYRDAVGSKKLEKEKRSSRKKTLIISTSITRGISDEKFSNLHGGEVKFKRIHGGKARWIKEDVKKYLPSKDWQNVVLQMGGNDLQDLYYPEAISRLANTIIETGLICKERGAETVFISGNPVRSYAYTWERCRTLNGELKDLCRRNNFVFINNESITHTNHLHHDGIHLNSDGDSLLANNYLDSIKKFCAEN